MTESPRLRFGMHRGLVKSISSHKEKEARLGGWTTWVDPGTMLDMSPDGSLNFSVPKNVRILLRLEKIEYPSGRKRVPTTVEIITSNGEEVSEIYAFGSYETIVSKGTTVYALENWFRPSVKKKPRIFQRKMNL